VQCNFKSVRLAINGEKVKAKFERISCQNFAKNIYEFLKMTICLFVIDKKDLPAKMEHFCLN